MSPKRSLMLPMSMTFKGIRTEYVLTMILSLADLLSLVVLARTFHAVLVGLISHLGPSDRVLGLDVFTGCLQAYATYGNFPIH